MSLEANIKTLTEAVLALTSELKAQRAAALDPTPENINKIHREMYANAVDSVTDGGLHEALLEEAEQARAEGFASDEEVADVIATAELIGEEPTEPVTYEKVRELVFAVSKKNRKEAEGLLRQLGVEKISHIPEPQWAQAAALAESFLADGATITFIA